MPRFPAPYSPSLGLLLGERKLKQLAPLCAGT